MHLQSNATNTKSIACDRRMDMDESIQAPCRFDTEMPDWVTALMGTERERSGDTRLLRGQGMTQIPFWKLLSVNTVRGHGE